MRPSCFQRSVSVFLCLVFLIPILNLRVSAEPEKPKNDDEVYSYLQEVAEAIGVEGEISKAKEIQDFANNVYYIGEVEDCGYLIIDLETGSLLEYSLTAPSPYRNKDEDLYYLGPTYYYTYNRDSCCFVHTIIDETIKITDLEYIEKAKSWSYKMQETLQKENEWKCETLLETGVIKNYSPDDLIFEYEIQNHDWIERLETNQQIGYYEVNNGNETEGCCGFIAAGMLLLWHDCFGNVDLINDFIYVNSGKTGFRGPNLTRYLLTLGNGPSSSASGLLAESSIDDVLQSYFTNRYLSGDTTIISLFHYPVIYHLYNDETPIIIFGALDNPRYPEVPNSSPIITHAVLGYGYNTYLSENDTATYMVKSHFGWAGNYHSIFINLSLMGEALYISNLSSGTPTVNDVSTTSWAYGPAVFCIRNGLMEYASGSNFAPSAAATREVFVYALYQAAGAPKVTSADWSALSSTFQDISAANPKYLAALAWAYVHGVMSGTSATMMAPKGLLTRAQAVTFLRAYSTAMGDTRKYTSGPSASSFPDYSDIPNYARVPFNWATTGYLITGSSGYLLPNNTLTRAQTAAIVRTYTEKMNRQ